jgi:hypothetical protein
MDQPPAHPSQAVMLPCIRPRHLAMVFTMNVGRHRWGGEDKQSFRIWCLLLWSTSHKQQYQTGAIMFMTEQTFISRHQSARLNLPPSLTKASHHVVRDPPAVRLTKPPCTCCSRHSNPRLQTAYLVTTFLSFYGTQRLMTVEMLYCSITLCVRQCLLLFHSHNLVQIPDTLCSYYMLQPTVAIIRYIQPL